MKMCSKVDQTATLSPQDNYFPEVLENCKEICYNVENAKAKWRKPDEEVRIMAVTKTVPPEKVNFAVAQGFKLLGENRGFFPRRKLTIKVQKCSLSDICRPIR